MAALEVRRPGKFYFLQRVEPLSPLVVVVPKGLCPNACLSFHFLPDCWWGGTHLHPRARFDGGGLIQMAYAASYCHKGTVNDFSLLCTLVEMMISSSELYKC